MPFLRLPKLQLVLAVGTLHAVKVVALRRAMHEPKIRTLAIAAIADLEDGIAIGEELECGQDILTFQVEGGVLINAIVYLHVRLPFSLYVEAGATRARNSTPTIECTILRRLVPKWRDAFRGTK